MLIYLLILTVALACEQEEYCYSEHPDKFHSWGVKQSYSEVRGEQKELPNELKLCEIVNVWTILRHGVRFPKLDEAEQMKELLIPLREEIVSSNTTRLCNSEVGAFKSWCFDNDLISRASELTDFGSDESSDTGKRFASKYLTDKFQVYLRSTPDNYTKSSLKSFYNGLKKTDENKSEYHIQKSVKEDPVIAPYESCKKWKVYQNNSAQDEPRKFIKSNIFQDLIKRVEVRLGVSCVTSDTIISMWEICRFYKVVYPNVVCPWCAAFRTEDFQILEYYDDLFQFYYASYGSELNFKLGAVTLKNLVKEFNSTIFSDDKPKTATVYVGHLTITEMIMTALNIGKEDVPLSTKHAKDLIHSRKFKTNNLQPYGANFAAVLYRCRCGDHKVQIFHNEDVVKFDNKIYLSWYMFMKRFKKFAFSNLKFCKE